jgi:small subunit ribosomal protein S1
LPGSHLWTAPRRRLDWQNLAPQIRKSTAKPISFVVSNRKAVVEQQMADLSCGDLVSVWSRRSSLYGAFVVGGMSFAHFANLVSIVSTTSKRSCSQ